MTLGITALERLGFRDHFASCLATLPVEVMAQHLIVELDATTAPWMDTELTVQSGDQVTVLYCGRIYIDEAADVWLDPGLQVWTRVGGRGPIVRSGRASNTFSATHDGNVELGNVNPAEWIDVDGNIGDDASGYGFMSGGTTVALLHWASGADPVSELRRLASTMDFDGVLATEVDRLAQRAGAAPSDWEHLWYLGPSEVFNEEVRGVITCSTLNTFAIICHDADFALTPDTTLSWAWKVDQLPSAVAEDAFATHDYLSIAVEFDDGLDLTYQWSAALEPETFYRCPLPHWSERETHLVVRSGPTELGQWLQEKRHIFADRATAIGGPDPARITRIWLIAVSFLQHGEGNCSYSDITVANRTTQRTIL